MTVSFNTIATYTCDMCNTVAEVPGVGAAPAMPDGWMIVGEKHCCSKPCATDALSAA